MKKYWRKLVNYYHYNGLKSTIKAIFRKIFMPFKPKYLKNIEKLKNFNLETVTQNEIKKETKIYLYLQLSLILMLGVVKDLHNLLKLLIN